MPRAGIPGIILRRRTTIGSSEIWNICRIFNLLEENLQKLVASSADPGIGPLHRWEGNGASPTAADLNRIEGGMLALYQMLQQQKNAQPKLAFGLNRREF